MIYLIIGRTASGKDYLGKLLESKGLKGVKSYTTRPKRSEDEDSHIFISEDEASKFDDRVAETVINGFQYFATREEVEKSDFYIIDPEGAYMLARMMPDTAFRILYADAPSDERRKHFVERSGDPDAGKLFDERNNAETAQFDDFERMFKNDGLKAFDNFYSLHVFENSYSETEAEDCAALIKDQFNVHNSLVNILETCKPKGFVKCDDSGRVAVFYKDNESEPIFVSNDRFVSIMMADLYGLGMFTEAVLRFADLNVNIRPES